MGVGKITLVLGILSEFVMGVCLIFLSPSKAGDIDKVLSVRLQL